MIYTQKRSFWSEFSNVNSDSSLKLIQVGIARISIMYYMIVLGFEFLIKYDPKMRTWYKNLIHIQKWPFWSEFLNVNSDSSFNLILVGIARIAIMYCMIVLDFEFPIKYHHRKRN